MRLLTLSPGVCAAVLACTAIGLSHSTYAHTPPNPLAFANMLFPQVSGWQDLQTAQKISDGELASLRAPLSQALRSAARRNAFHDSVDCAFLPRALALPQTGNWYRVDIDQDGVLDIVYSGSAQCAEGARTLIWYGGKQGYLLRDTSYWPMLLLRFAQKAADGSVRIISYAEGCCGNPVDQYYSGYLSNPRQLGQIGVASDTEMPAKRGAQILRVRAKSELRLRTSPKVNDQLDKGLSEFLNAAAFGNLLRIYLTGAKGNVLSSEEKNGELWHFVTMDMASDVMVTHDPFRDVRAGWVRAAQVEKD